MIIMNSFPQNNLLQNIPGVSTTLNDNSWETIRAVSDAGQGKRYWNVGDTKRIILNGLVGNTMISNLAVDVFIIGFNHNASLEGNNRIHFQLGKIGGVPVAFKDEDYGKTSTKIGCFHMNLGVTKGGWEGSPMRISILGNNSTPASPSPKSLLSALPSDIRLVMKPCTKYSDNTGSVSGTSSSRLSSTEDYLFLLSEYEYHGAIEWSMQSEKTSQARYEYYNNISSVIKYRHDNTSSPINHWCRSTRDRDTALFCRVYSTGERSVANSSYSQGISPAFCV